MYYVKLGGGIETYFLFKKFLELHLAIELKMFLLQTKKICKSIRIFQYKF